MKILVFGKTGQVACALQEQCPKGFDLISLDRMQADFMQPETCAAIIMETDADVVINAVAYTAVDKAESEQAIATVVNTDTPGVLARACAVRDLPFLHVSTDYVFNGSGENPWHPGDKPAPINSYGRSKNAGEQEIVAANGQHVILRTSWVFSAHGQNFVKSMLRLGETNNSLSIVADQIGGPTPALAIADALFIIADKVVNDKTIKGIFHFSGTPNVSWAEFAQEIFILAKKKIDIVNIDTKAYPTPAKRPLNSQLDCSSLRQQFGIRRPDWREGIKTVLEEWKRL